MFAAIRKAAPFAAIAVAAILGGCTVEAAPYSPDVYAYSGPSTVFVGPCCYYHYGYSGHYYGGYHGYGGGYHGGGMHGGR